MPLSGETPLDISNSAVIPFDGVALGGDLVAFRTNLNSLFLSYQLSGKRKKKIAKLAQGKSIVHSNPEYLMKLYIFYPTKEEQNKIVNTLNLLAKKINILRDKIATLKKYKDGIINILLKDNKSIGKLKENVIICNKTKLPSSYGNDDGKYPFFINNDEGIEKYCNDYIFDGVYIILNTGGSSSIKFYDGKFSAMSDCLVIKPKNNSLGIYYFLKSINTKINNISFQGTGLKHLEANWLYNKEVFIPKLEEQKLKRLNENFNSLINYYDEKLNKLFLIKQYLLSNLFI